MKARVGELPPSDTFACEKVTLANGLRLMYVPMPAVRSAAITFFVGLGSRHEPASRAGIAHMIEHMMFKGTETRPNSRSISETLDAVGGYLNASTDKELTSYWAKVASDHLPLAVELLADMLLRSRFAPSDLAREKRVVTEELRMLRDDPQDRVHVLAEENLWPDQAIGREIAGTTETVESFRRRDLLEYVHGRYRPNNTVVAVAGGVAMRDVVDLLHEHFAGWIPDEIPRVEVAAQVARGQRVTTERKPIEQVQLCIAYPGLPREDPDRPALDVLSTILGGGTSSRLFIELRDKRALAYDTHAYTTYLRDTGSFVVYVGTEPRNVDEVLTAVERQIDRLRRRKLPDQELDRTKHFIRGRTWLGLEDPQAVANWFGAQEMLQHEVLTPTQAVDAVDAVTTHDLRRLARTILRPENALVAALGPVDDVRVSENLLS